MSEMTLRLLLEIKDMLTAQAERLDEIEEKLNDLRVTTGDDEYSFISVE